MSDKQYCENSTIHPQDYRILSTGHSTSMGNNNDTKKLNLKIFSSQKDEKFAMESQFRDFDHEEVLFLAFLQLNVNFMDTWITFFIITNQQNILAKFIILITNRFFPLVSRRQRFFYTVCYKLRSRKMRIRYLVFPIPLFFSFLLSFSFFSSFLFFFFFHTVRYKLRSPRMRTRLLCFLLCFLFFHFISSFFFTRFATTHSQMLGKFEYTGGPIFKVVLEC